MNLFEITKEKAASSFMFGGCGSFALALQKIIGGKIYSLVRDDKTLHLFVKLNGKNYDVKGQRGTYPMAMDCVGSTDRINIVGPLDNNLPVDVTPSKIKAATEYILANKSIFGLE